MSRPNSLCVSISLSIINTEIPMSKFNVRPEKEQELIKRMRELGIREEDIQETFVRSRGPGGQNVNKASTAVQLKHVPTGIVVKVQRERSQAINRFLARRLLISRIEEKMYGKKSPEQLKVEKKQKQKKRRRKRTTSKRHSPRSRPTRSQNSCSPRVRQAHPRP